MGYNQNYSGATGSGGAAPVITSHTPDGDTLSHWDFGTDLTDDTGTADLAGTYAATTQGGNDGALHTGASTFIKTAPGASYTGLHGAMSFGMLIRVDALPASYCSLFSIQPIGGGAGSANNQVFNLRYEADGTLLWIQEHGSKVSSVYGFTTLSPPIGEWCWIGASRNAAGTEITVAVNSDEVTHSSLTQGDGGGNADILIATGWDNRVLHGAVKSVILKDVESDLTTLRAETGL